jgi:low temperature requirement protein LtrA
MSEQAMEHEHRITPLELFFDLVFVFAFTQVTTVMSEHPTWVGVGHALLILSALWWAWASYAWLTNTVDAGEDGVLAAVLGAMAAMFVAALAVPTAFSRHGVIFGVAFLIVAVMYLVLYALSARGEPELFVAILRIVPSSLLGAALILAAGFVDDPGRSTIWIAALAVGFLGPFLGGISGWRLAPATLAPGRGPCVDSRPRTCSSRRNATGPPLRAGQRLASRSARHRQPRRHRSRPAFRACTARSSRP